MPTADFDPLTGLDEDDKAYLSGIKSAFTRQAAARGDVDEERKRAAEEHMRATQQANGITPSAAPLAQAVAARQVVAAIPGKVSLMVARPDTPTHSLPPTTEKFAPDWPSMREIISKYDGTWIVSRHEFSTSVADMLGFFGKDGWPKPQDSEKETFEVIVKNGKSFRTDPA